MKYGLKDTPRDDRDFKLGAITTLPPLSELPLEFVIPEHGIKNQRQSDFCTAFAFAGVSELQEGVALSAEWAFAKSKELSGDVEEWGQDLRKGAAVHTRFGCAPQSAVPFTVANESPDFLRRIENYPDVGAQAIKHVKKSYVTVSGQYDYFDDIRAALWKYRNERRGVVTGVRFGWEPTKKILNTIPLDGQGHAMYINGWVTLGGVPYLRYVNSFGTRSGDNGVHYVSREVVNHFVALYGAFMFLDMEPEQVRYMQERGITDKDNWIVQILKSVVSLLQQLVAKKK